MFCIDWTVLECYFYGNVQSATELCIMHALDLSLVYYIILNIFIHHNW